MKQWTLEQALELCRLIEEIAPRFGAHVALTGGVLYKDGPRKDLDLVFYRIRQTEQIDIAGLIFQLERDLEIQADTGLMHEWIVKATFRERKIDLFFPEGSKPRPVSKTKTYA